MHALLNTYMKYEDADIWDKWRADKTKSENCLGLFQPRLWNDKMQYHSAGIISFINFSMLFCKRQHMNINLVGYISLFYIVTYTNSKFFYSERNPNHYATCDVCTCVCGPFIITYRQININSYDLIRIQDKILSQPRYKS